MYQKTVAIVFNITISNNALVGDIIELMIQIDDGTYSAYITNDIVIGIQVMMDNLELTTCSGIFFDSKGGFANYGDSEDYTATFYPGYRRSAHKG